MKLVRIEKWRQFSTHHSENRTDVLTAAAPLFSLYAGAQLMELPARKIMRA